MKNTQDEQVTISRSEYEQLLEDQKILNALIAGGVDNWEWYDESLAVLEN
jgi:hypothetical protein